MDASILWPESSPFAQYLASHGHDDVLETFAALPASAPDGATAIPKRSRLVNSCLAAIVPQTCELIHPFLLRCHALASRSSSASADADRVAASDSATLSVSAGVFTRLCVSASLLAVAIGIALASSNRAWHVELDGIACCGVASISAAVLSLYFNLSWVRLLSRSLCVQCFCRCSPLDFNSCVQLFFFHFSANIVQSSCGSSVR